MKIGHWNFQNYTYIFGIINVTPDSFYAPSRQTEYTLLKTVERFEKEGVSVLDVGAQSTRPGHTPVTAEEELRRLEQPIRLIKENFDLPLSVDTFYSSVACQVLAEGADLINDVWGLSLDDRMAQVIAERGASVCIMHNATAPIEGDVFPPVLSFLQKAVERAKTAGIEEDRICLDGGIGFAKSKQQNWDLLNGYDRLSALGYPLLLGTSRKSLFGGLPEERLPQTLESTLSACRQGVLFVRVHDVKENREVIRRYYGD